MINAYRTPLRLSQLSIHGAELDVFKVQLLPDVKARCSWLPTTVVDGLHSNALPLPEDLHTFEVQSLPDVKARCSSPPAAVANGLHSDVLPLPEDELASLHAPPLAQLAVPLRLISQRTDTCVEGDSPDLHLSCAV
jgi:hypothetical protein